MLLNWAEVSGQMVTTKKVRQLTGLGKRQGMINLPHLRGTQVTSMFISLLLAGGVVAILGLCSKHVLLDSMLGT